MRDFLGQKFCDSSYMLVSVKRFVSPCLDDEGVGEAFFSGFRQAFCFTSSLLLSPLFLLIAPSFFNLPPTVLPPSPLSFVSNFLWYVLVSVLSHVLSLAGGDTTSFAQSLTTAPRCGSMVAGL